MEPGFAREFQPLLSKLVRGEMPEAVNALFEKGRAPLMLFAMDSEEGEPVESFESTTSNGTAVITIAGPLMKYDNCGTLVV